MDFTVKRDPFLHALSLAQAIADRKSTIPILSNVLMRTDGKTLLVAGSDLQSSVTANIPITTRKEGGLTVGAKALHAFVKELSAEEVSVKATDNSYAEVRAGKSHCRMIALPDRDFPKLPDHREAEFFEFDGAILRDVIDKTIGCVRTEDDRPPFNGLLLSSDGKQATAMATDGHHAAVIDRPFKGKPFRVVLHHQKLSDLRRLIDSASDVRFAFKDANVFVATGNTVMTVQSIAMEFPDVRGAFPKEVNCAAIAPKEELLGTIRRVALFSDSDGGVTFRFYKNELEIIGSGDSAKGDGRDSVAVDYDGPTWSFRASAALIKERASMVDGDKVVIETVGGGPEDYAPIVVRGEGDDRFISAVMPMRILKTDRVEAA